jgi:PPOX class probable F420-dependent enzyme
VEATEARALFATARVARLATADPDGRPHLVPICFALDDEEILTAVDQKPKRTTRLRRLANVATNPMVSVLADRYVDSD